MENYIIMNSSLIGAIFIVNNSLAKEFTLGKNERLKSRKQIEELFDKGKTFVVSPFRIHYLLKKDIEEQIPIPGLQFGIGVSGKNFKRAVDRNRIKRLIREAYRLQKNFLKENLKEKKWSLSVFITYTNKELPEFKLVNEKVAVVLKKLESIIDENIS